jgi:hypothetical protein
MGFGNPVDPEEWIMKAILLDDAEVLIGMEEKSIGLVASYFDFSGMVKVLHFRTSWIAGRDLAVEDV